jgi:hypothetical protein
MISKVHKLRNWYGDRISALKFTRGAFAKDSIAYHAYGIEVEVLELAKSKLDQIIPTSDIEYILCAAIWFDDGKFYEHQPINIPSGIVLCGWRHGCIFPQIGGLVSERQQLGIHEKEQGFVTNKNRFVDRKEGRKIAFESGQTDEETGQLFSEDLW